MKWNLSVLNKELDRLFQTDMRYVIHNGRWQMLGQMSMAGMTFVLSIAFANLLTQQDYGIYKFILSIAAVIGAARLTGLNQAITQATARGYTGTILAAQKMNLKWSLIPIVLYSAIALYYYANDNLILSFGILIAGLSAVIVSTVGLYGSYLAGLTQYRQLNLDITIVSLIGAGAMLSTLLITDSISAIITVSSLSTAIPYTLLSRIRLKGVSTQEQVDYNSLRFAKHLSVQNIISVAAAHADKILLFQRFGGVELAVYAFSVAVPEQLRGVLKNLLNIIIPKYAELGIAPLRKSIKKKALQLTALTLFPTIGYIIIAPFLFAVLFPQYTEAVIYSQWIMVSILVFPYNLLIGTYFTVQEQTKTIYKFQVISNVLRLIISAGLVFTFGLPGAVAAYIITKFTSSLVLTYFYYQDRGRT